MKTLTIEEKEMIRNLCQSSIIALMAVEDEEGERTIETLEALHEAENAYIVALEDALLDELWNGGEEDTEEDKGTVTISRAEYEELIAAKTKFEMARTKVAESSYRDAFERAVFGLAESPDCDNCNGHKEGCKKTICPAL